MKLKRLIVAESLVLLVILVAVVFSFQLIPGLQPQQNQIGMYKQISYNENSLTIARDQWITKTFNYTNFDPAIILLQVDLKECREIGYLNIYCNYRKIVSLYLMPQNGSATFCLFSCSGFDWIEPLSDMSGLNDLLFESPIIGGFEGSFTYQLSFRGSR